MNDKLDVCDEFEAPQLFRIFLERFLVGSGRLIVSHVTIVFFPMASWSSLKYDQ